MDQDLKDQLKLLEETIRGQIRYFDTLSLDIKDIKKEMSAIEEAINITREKTIENVKDIEFLRAELISHRTDQVKEYDIIHNLFRERDKACEKHRKDIKQDTIKDVKLWILVSICIAIGGIAISVANMQIQKLFKTQQEQQNDNNKRR